MKTKTLTKLVTILALFMLLACEKQEILQLEEETQTTESNINLESFEIKENTDLASEINNLTKSSKIGWTSKSTEDHIVLDESRVLAVTDSVGNSTFSIRMYVPETPHNVFHNLVLKQASDGKMNEPFVLRYEVAEDYWNTYISNNRKDAPFQGNLDVFSISSFIEGSSKMSKNGAGGEPCFNNIPVNGSNGSGSSSSGGSGGNGNFGNTGTSGGFAPVGIVWSDTGSSGGGYVEVGKGVFGRPAPDDGDTKKSYTAKNGECPEDEMLVPINELVWPYPDCSSFEYANFGNIKGAKIVGVNNTFFSYRTISPSRTEISTINIAYPSLFFTMPKTWTNGRSATLSARALNRAIDLTQDWFESNPTSSHLQLQLNFMANIKAQMARYGGTVGTSDKFTVRSPAPYKTSWFRSNCG